MEWSFVFKSFLFGISSGLGVLAAFAWLSKKIISHYLDKDLEGFKKDLKSASDAKLEEIKNAYVIAELEHEVRFKSLNQKRFELIAELYSKLAQLHKAMENFTKIMVSQEDLPESKRADEAANLFTDFYKFYLKNKLFFTAEECDRIEEFTKTIFEIHIDFTYRRLTGKEIDTWINVRKKMDEDVKNLKKDIEDRFRLKLGISD